jgi:hypothetical protein
MMLHAWHVTITDGGDAEIELAYAKKGSGAIKPLVRSDRLSVSDQTHPAMFFFTSGPSERGISAGDITYSGL